MHEKLESLALECRSDANCRQAKADRFVSRYSAKTYGFRFFSALTETPVMRKYFLRMIHLRYWFGHSRRRCGGVIALIRKILHL